jgi:signal transduction histidine kinase
MMGMVVTAALVTLAAGLLGSGVVWLVRARSAVTALTTTVLVAVLAAVSGVVVATREMLISSHDLLVLAAIASTAAAVGTACALAVGRRVARIVEGHARTAAELERQRALDADRRELVAWMSHDLRSPLAGIRAMAEALEDGVVADATSVNVYHRAIRDQVDRLAVMVDDLLELSRLHSGRLILRRQRVTLADVVAQAVATVGPLAVVRDVRLVGDAPDVTVDVDVREVTRVLVNLLSNAISHTPDGGTVRVFGGPSGDDTHLAAYLAVEDECGGIPVADLPRVFDVAFRGTPARTPRPTEGAGLGLAIARGIVEAHAGRITVRNVENGCRFTVCLPTASPGDSSPDTSRRPRLATR